MEIGVFDIVNCCGDYIKTVAINVSLVRIGRNNWSEVDEIDVEIAYSKDALYEGGIEQSVCSGCGDQSYYARVVGIWGGTKRDLVPHWNE